MNTPVRCALTILLSAGALLGSESSPTSGITAQQVIERIQKQTGIPWQAVTVDTVKAGDPATPVTGIAVTMMTTLDVLQRAAATGANLVITHEPTFYGHLDLVEPMASEGDPVLAAKRDFIQAHHLVVWRFHDHIHRMQPDMIVTGVVRALGWQEFQRHSAQATFVIPETSLADLAARIRTRLGIRTLRVVGDPRLRVTKAGFSPGFSGFNANRALLQDDEVEVLVLGEAHEWETIEYAADAVTAGKRKALIVLGHIPSEQAGMEECARWLTTFVPEVPVIFVATPEPFWAPPPAP